MPIIELQKVTKSFGDNPVLKKIDLKIKQGKLIGIKGESGAGKTTLMKVMIGCTDFDSGEIYYKLKKQRYHLNQVKKFHDFHNNVGFSCQEGSFYDDLSVRENLDFYGTMHGLSKNEIDLKTKRILPLVNLSGKENVLSGNLSAGMQKRLDIACSLIHEPQIVFLDEPTAHLDRDNQKEIWGLIRKINKKGITTIVTSHFPKDLKNYCNKVYELKKRIIK